MVITNFSGGGIGFGFSVGCGFGVGWGFGGTPLNILGVVLGGGCGVGLDLGWGFGTLVMVVSIILPGLHFMV